MAIRRNLNLLLGGLLTIGIADLIWLNGWIAPVVFEGNNHDVNAPVAVAPTHNQDVFEPVQVPQKPVLADPVNIRVSQEPVDEPVYEPVDEPVDEPVEVAPKQSAELASNPQSAIIEDMNVFFRTAAIVITPFYKKKLRSLAKQLGLRHQSGSARHLRIFGYADERGTNDYNDDLALRRAKAVQRYLQRHGVYSKSMTTKTFGERRPIANAALRKQRRVEVRLSEGE